MIRPSLAYIEKELTNIDKCYKILVFNELIYYKIRI